MVPDAMSKPHDLALSQHHKSSPTRRAINTYLLPTLLDRLVDDEPRQQTETPESYAVSPERMRAIVQRDLVWLLNTTNLADEIDASLYPQAATSVLNYGVPPFAGGFISERNWNEIERIVRHAILTFEPRFLGESLQIIPLADVSSDQNYNVLSFEIRGLVHMQPYPMAFLVQSSLDLETRRLVFK